MAYNTEKEFKKCLNKICNDKLLQEYVMDFYYDLAKKYKDDYFTKDNFETLMVDGYEVEQDIVKELFVNRDKVKAEEILLYLMKNNINLIYFFTKSKIANEVGYVDLNEKVLGIKLEDISKFYEEPKMKKIFDKNDMYNKHLTKQQKKEMKEVVLTYQKEKEEVLKKAEEKRKSLIKEYLYHEMSHIFEIKSFNNRKYIKNNATNVILTKGLKNNYIYCNSPDIQTDKLEELKKRTEEMMQNKSQFTIEEFVNVYSRYGANALSEIFNEIYARNLDNKFKVQFTFNQYNYDNYIKKSEMINNTAYNVDYDVALFVQLALNNFDEKNYRFNSKKMVEKINSLPVSKEKLNIVKNKLIKFLMDTNSSDKSKNLYQQLAVQIKNIDIYTTISLILGIHHNLHLLYNNDLRQNDLKVLIQDILVEAIKNNVISSFNNQTIKKDEEYFKKLNDILLKIDDFLWYPNTDIIINKNSKNLKIKEINLLSIEEFVKYHKEYSHISNFRHLLVKVKSMIIKHSKQIDNIDEIMTYFEEQKILDENWNELIAEHTTPKNNTSYKKNDVIINQLNKE